MASHQSTSDFPVVGVELSREVELFSSTSQLGDSHEAVVLELQGPASEEDGHVEEHGDVEGVESEVLGHVEELAEVHGLVEELEGHDAHGPVEVRLCPLMPA